ncbi:hypothetical protein SRHO_G00171370 [Serrasalmus rhombeus]
MSPASESRRWSSQWCQKWDVMAEIDQLEQQILKLSAGKLHRESGGLREVGAGRYAGAALPDGASQPRARLASDEPPLALREGTRGPGLAATVEREEARKGRKTGCPRSRASHAETRTQGQPVSRSRAGGKRAQGPPVRDGVPLKANTLERELVVGRLGTGHGLWLKCIVQGVPVTALVDTGSTVSIIRPGALCLLRKNAAVAWDPTDTMLRSVTGERIKMGGKKRLCVGLAKRTLQHEFCLAPIRDACILGLDFLKALGAVLDIPAAALILGRTRIPLAAPPTAEPDRAVATASVYRPGTRGRLGPDRHQSKGRV